MHIAKWTKYCYLDAGVKKLFFDIIRIYRLQTTLYAYARPHSIPLRIMTGKEIVDIIIGDMVFHPEGLDRITQARLLARFLTTIYYSEDASYAWDIIWYAIIVRNTKQFRLVAQYLAAGMSFHQLAQVMVDTKELLGIYIIGSCSEVIVNRYAHFICAMNLQFITELFMKCWAFSIALDIAMHLSEDASDARNIS